MPAGVKQQVHAPLDLEEPLNSVEEDRAEDRDDRGQDRGDDESSDED